MPCPCPTPTNSAVFIQDRGHPTQPTVWPSSESTTTSSYGCAARGGDDCLSLKVSKCEAASIVHIFFSWKCICTTRNNGAVLGRVSHQKPVALKGVAPQGQEPSTPLMLSESAFLCALMALYRRSICHCSLYVGNTQLRRGHGSGLVSAKNFTMTLFVRVS